MMGPGEVLAALFVVGIPTLVLGSIFTRWFRLKEKKLELEANRAAEKAAQYAASNAELEARVRVLEKIVTGPISPDSGSTPPPAAKPPPPPPPPGPGAAGILRIFLSTGAERSPMMRFVHWLVTLISSLFSPGLSALVMSIRYGAFQISPTERPLIATSAMSPTRPRSSSSAAPEGNHSGGAVMIFV